MFSICDSMLQWVHTKAAKLWFDVVIGRSYSDSDRTHPFDTMAIYPRGVKQGDCLSSIFFCIVEEVLGGQIFKLSE